MICSRFVFRCFKTLERWGDKLTGAAGPFFVTLAIALISTGVICFFDVIMPDLAYPLISGPICVLIAFNLLTHYYFVCTVSPGFVDEPPAMPKSGFMWARRRQNNPLTHNPSLTAGGVKITPATMSQCRKCMRMRPERSHHCRICKRCVLKFDHHCPNLQWINQCVGIYNERHFVLFMAYLVLSTFCFSILGWPQIQDALGMTWPRTWPYRVPSMLYAMTYILSVVLCLAVGVMLSFHFWGVASAETSVESQDHDHYRKIAIRRGDTFVNSYHVSKRQNIQLFFNIGPNGYSVATLFFPFRIMPYTDGRSWARREGYERHHGIRDGDEFTDDEDEEEARLRQQRRAEGA